MPEQIPSASFIRDACGLASDIAWWASDDAAFNEDWLRIAALQEKSTRWQILRMSYYGVCPDVTAYKNTPDAIIAQCRFPGERWKGWNATVMQAYEALVVSVWHDVLQPLAKTPNDLKVIVGRASLSPIARNASALLVAVQDHDYGDARTPDEWAKVFDQSWRTIRRRINTGEIRAIEIHSKSWRIHRGDVPTAP
ncbi:MAG: hypothetical protein WD872_09595 [Pirellulaceae bacterium]